MKKILEPISEYGGLRSLKGREEDISLQIRDVKSNTLVLIKSDWKVDQASNRSDKDSLIEKYKEDEGDILLLVWGGRWSNDVFQIDREDLDKYY